MDQSELANLAAKAREVTAKIQSADTPENEARLTVALAGAGMKLKKGRGKGPQRFTLVDPKGNELQGVTLADAESVLAKLQSQRA